MRNLGLFLDHFSASLRSLAFKFGLHNADIAGHNGYAGTIRYYGARHLVIGCLTKPSISS